MSIISRTRRHFLVVVAMFLFIAPVSALAGCGGDDAPAVAGANTAASKATEAKPSTAASSAGTSASATAPAPTTAAAPLDGTWSGTWRASATSDNGTVRIQWKQTGAQLAGTIVVSNTPCVMSGTITGQVNGNTITFGAVQSVTTISYTGTLAGNTITGTYKADASCGNATGSWTATRG